MPKGGPKGPGVGVGDGDIPLGEGGGMTVGAPLTVGRFRGDVVDGTTGKQGYVAPVSLASPWMTVIDAGGLTVQDAATITDPTGLC